MADIELIIEALREAGRRNSASDLSIIQQVHDAAIRLGAECAEPDADDVAEADPPEPGAAAKALSAKKVGDKVSVTVGTDTGKMDTVTGEIVGMYDGYARIATKGGNVDISFDSARALRESEPEVSMNEADSGESVEILEAGPSISAFGPSALVTLAEANPRFDADKREVWITPIKPGFGNPKDGFYYPSKTIREAVEAGIFNNRKMYANHPRRTDEKELPERSVRDWVATVKETVWDDANGVPRSRVKVYDKDAFARWQDAPDEIAFSILGGGVARGGRVGNREARIVESFKNIRSIDWVTEAGAGGAIEFAESAADAEELEMDLKNLTREQLMDARPDLFTEAASDTPPDGYVSREEFDELKRELTEKKMAEAVAAAKGEASTLVESLLKQTTLVSAARDHIRESFAEATLGEGMQFETRESLEAAAKVQITAFQKTQDQLLGGRSSVKGLGAASTAQPVSTREAMESRLDERMREAMPAKAVILSGDDERPAEISESSKSVADRMAARI